MKFTVIKVTGNVKNMIKITGSHFKITLTRLCFNHNQVINLYLKLSQDLKKDEKL